MEPVTLSIDLDGTLADFITPALRTVNERFGTNYTPDSFPTKPFGPHLPPEQRAAFQGFVADPEIYRTLDPLPDGVACTLALARAGYPIIITSHRPPASLIPTRDWLLAQGIPYLGLEVSFDSKAVVSARYGPDRPLIFVDDDPNLVQTLALPHPGVEIWLLAGPHTGGVDPQLARVFPSWPDLTEALLEMKEPQLELAATL